MTSIRKRISLLALALLTVLGTVACSGDGGKTPGTSGTASSAAVTTASDETEPTASSAPQGTEPPATIEPDPDQPVDTTPLFFMDLNLEREHEVMQAISGEGGNNSKLLQEDSLRIYAEKTIPEAKYSWRVGFHTDTFTATGDQVILIRLKNNSMSNKLVMFADPSKDANNVFAFQGRCDITPYMEQYVDYIYNIADNTLQGSWVGEVNRFRLQFAALGEVDIENDFVDIAYFGIFANETSAEQFDIDEWRAANKPSGIKTEVVSKGRPTLLFDFGTSTEAEIRAALMDSLGEVSFTQDAVKVTADDKGWRLMLSCQLEAVQGSYMKIRIKNESDSTQFKLWTSPIMSSNLIFLTLPQISANDTDYKEYIVKVDAKENFSQGDWNGTVVRMRFDLGTAPNPSVGDSMTIDYIGFFSTLEDAQNFNP